MTSSFSAKAQSVAFVPDMNLNIEREYMVLAYDTRTGRVVRELPLAAEPTWDVRLNDVGGGGVTCPLGTLDRWKNLYEIRRPYRYSLAVGLSGTPVDSPLVQAGPIVSYAPDEEPPQGAVPKVSYAFQGFWELLNRRLMTTRTWNPATAPITDASADLNIENNSLANIAAVLIDFATTQQFRAGSDLPVDVVPAFPTDDNERHYHGWELISFGQRLQELTQVDGGPDVVFQPYLTTSGGYRQVRHRPLVGNPYLVQPGVPLRFDYRSNLVKIAINGAGDGTANTAWVKGTGNENAQQYGYATNQALIAKGWPLLDYVDSGHTSTLIQGSLDSWAAADVALLSNLPEQWKATVKTESNPRLGSYSPGHFVSYNILDHHWIPDGLYTWRLISMARTGSTQKGTIEQVIQALGSY